MHTASVRRVVGIAAVAVGLVGAMSVAPASADPAPWTSQPAAAPTVPSGVLTGVACPTASLCLAVGTVSSPAGSTTSFAQKWNGTAWTRVASTTPAGAVSARLDGVSCVNATTCVAVGSWRPDATSDNTRPFAARWNGTAFVASSVPPATGLPSSGLRGVSCLTGTLQCVAVGYATKSGGGQPYAVVYRGGNTWQALADPPPGSGTAPSLDAVSCTSTTRCVAAGGPTYGSLVDTWDGSTWTLASTPDTNHLTGVACVGSSFCLAVSGQVVEGDSAGTLLYDGSSWSTRAVPHDSATAYRLRAVSCVSTADCTAVGDTLHPANGSHPTWTAATSFLVHWDGTAWSERTLPQRTPTSNNVLTGVACSASSCTAVGRFGTPVTLTYDTDSNEIDARPLALTGSGTTWQLRDVTGAKSTRTSQYYDISCPTRTFCAAVGQQGGFVDPIGEYQGQDRTEAESGLLATWNGTVWTTVSLPVDVEYLRKVSCATATACLAIGAAAHGPAVMRWNGTTWAAIAGPPGDAPTALSCDAPTSCTTLAYYATNSYHWNGTTWTPTPLPSTSGGVVDLSCTSAQNCIGVGYYYYYGAFIERRPVVLLLAATGWRQIRAVPAPNSGNTGLSGVSCTAANACTAVGDAAYGVEDATDPPPTSTALIITWDGHAWTQVASPTLSGRTALRDVSCTASNACTAVGVTGSADTGDPLVESWNGTAWTQVPASRPAGVFGVAPLAGASCVAGAACTAAGSVLVPDGGYRPYVLSGTN